VRWEGWGIHPGAAQIELEKKGRELGTKSFLAV